MYQLVDGDVQIVARVATVGNVNPKSKAGVMIPRRSPAPCRNTDVGIASMGWAWRSRAVGNGASVHMPGSPSAFPGWVRLVRQGDTFTGYESSDGVNWTLVGSETISMPSSVYVGLAVNSKDPSLTTTGTFTNVSITLPDLPGNLPPSSSITSPTGGSRFTAPATIALNASASTPTAPSRGDFDNGTTLLGSRWPPRTVHLVERGRIGTTAKAPRPTTRATETSATAPSR